MMHARVIQAYSSKQVRNSFNLLMDPSQSSLSIIEQQLKASQFKAKKGEFRLFYNIEGIKEKIVGVVGVGDDCSNLSARRIAAATAVKNIKSLDNNVPWNIIFEGSNESNWKQVAEGATLACYSFDSLKSVDKQSAPLSIYSGNVRESSEKSEWRLGEILAQSQNTARTLMETPGNLMTPSIFCQKAVELFGNDSLVKVFVRDREWIKEQKMNSFLSVSNGSPSQPLKFLEIQYRGCIKNPDQPSLALVGKGVTFDSGGISIKPSGDMAMMKGDMGGAAVVLSSLWGIVQLGLPLNIVAVIPLTENMPSGSATKPGDVVVARNGLSIEVDNTDAEGRLILADAIHYVGSTFKPSSIIELSTLTGAMDIALGEGYAGVFSTSDVLWRNLKKAGEEANDEFWRMPLSEDHYAHQIKSNVADLKNVGGRSAGSCTAAIFLKNFVPNDIPFAHIDIAGVMHTKRANGELIPGMTGRPTRAIIEYAQSILKA